VLVRRALDTPGPARSGKDIEVLIHWLREMPQFGHLGLLQVTKIDTSTL
jgi:hypothetical protein